MVTFGRSVYCTDVELYYYDYVCGLDADIPQAVADHIRQCAHCRTQIRQLEAAVAQSETQDCQGRGDEHVLGALNLHFAHLGEDITCAGAKSFLPPLLLPSLEIRIPTPITVHVDHCHQCAEDLEAIRELELRPEQLARLSQLFAATPGNSPERCRRTRAKTWAFACASFEGIDVRTLDHMCICPHCRRRVYRYREKILAGRQPGDTIPGIHLCDGISMADLFEWVVPYGRTGDDIEDVVLADEVMPAHLQACPECIEKMQTLHRTIYGIAERVDSGVSTVYTTDSQAQTSGGAESLYCGYPVHVEVMHRDPEPAVTRFQPIPAIREAWSRTVASRQFRPALTAAAMISLAILLLVTTQPASAIRVQDLADTIAGIQNLHLTQYTGDGTKPVQELLMARGAGLVRLKESENDTLYDLGKREKVIHHLDRGTVEQVSLTQVEQDSIMRHVDGILRQALAGAPRNRGLYPLVLEGAEDVRQAEIVYELAWNSRSSNDLVVQNRVRASLGPIGGLPQRMEWSQLTPDDEQWRPMAVREFKYPTRQEVELTLQGDFPEWSDHSEDHSGL
jgi:hypothetical protein